MKITNITADTKDNELIKGRDYQFTGEFEIEEKGETYSGGWEGWYDGTQMSDFLTDEVLLDDNETWLPVILESAVMGAAELAAHELYYERARELQRTDLDRDDL